MAKVKAWAWLSVNGSALVVSTIRPPKEWHQRGSLQRVEFEFPPRKPKPRKREAKRRIVK